MFEQADQVFARKQLPDVLAFPLKFNFHPEKFGAQRLQLGVFTCQAEVSEGVGLGFALSDAREVGSRTVVRQDHLFEVGFRKMPRVGSFFKSMD